jgi:hypothetical protein
MKKRLPELTILDVLDDPAVFGAQFSGATWEAWRALLVALFGLSASPEQADLIRCCTGRQDLPTTPAREVFCIVGRRGGKSRIAALLAVFLACFRKYTLAPGEVGVVMLIATDRRQARVLKRYIAGLLRAVPMLAAMIANETAEGIELTNRLVIEVHTASFRAVRGYTIVAAIVDEIAFLPVEGSANPDTELLTALRPAMATLRGSMLIAISSPYAQRGELYKAYREHFGKDGDPVLVWQADTRTMNPSVPQVVIDNAYRDDEAVASAEFGARFRRDVESFVRREAVEACIVPGRFELAPVQGQAYRCFVDPSGGSQDSMTLAIAHAEKGMFILDLVREVQPPFSPEATVLEFVGTLAPYGIHAVWGDRWGGEFCREPFRKHGIEYRLCEHAKSELYSMCLPLINSQRVALLDDPRLLAQLYALERHTARGGKDSIDHPPRAHDDVINAACGALALVAKAASVVPFSFSCAGQSLALGDEEPTPIGQPSGPGVITLPQPEPSLAERVKAIRDKPLCQRSQEEHQLVEQFFESQHQHFTRLDPISRAALSGGYIPGEGTSDLATDLEDVAQTFRRWR